MTLSDRSKSQHFEAIEKLFITSFYRRVSRDDLNQLIGAFADCGFALDTIAAQAPRDKDRSLFAMGWLLELKERPPQLLQFQDTGDVSTGRPNLREPVVQLDLAIGALLAALADCRGAALLEPLSGQLNTSAFFARYLEDRTEYQGGMLGVVPAESGQQPELPTLLQLLLMS